MEDDIKNLTCGNVIYFFDFFFIFALKYLIILFIALTNKEMSVTKLIILENLIMRSKTIFSYAMKRISFQARVTVYTYLLALMQKVEASLAFKVIYRTFRCKVNSSM